MATSRGRRLRAPVFGWLLAVGSPSGVFIVEAATVLGWHCKGFRLFWTWKVRHGKAGRPSVPKDVRELICTMSCEILWGAPRIHGELLKQGIAVGETSVSRYMVRATSQTEESHANRSRSAVVSLGRLINRTLENAELVAQCENLKLQRSTALNEAERRGQ